MNRQPAQVGGGDSVSDWYKEIPLVTKLLFTSTVAATVLVSTGMCDQGLFYFASHLILRKFHIWRLFTPFIFSFPFSIDFAMHTYLLYDNCRRYELNPFNTGGGGNSSDFLFMVLLGMAAMCVAAYFFNLSLMSNPLLYMIMYVWSRREPETIVSLFTFKYKALYSPWVSLLIYIVMGYSVTLPLIGIAVGHIYFFFISVLPDSHGIDLIRTPEFCEQAVRLYTGNSAAVSSRVSAAPAAAATGAQFPNLGAGHQWGRGRALGSD
jgi:Derlin-2/3